MAEQESVFKKFGTASQIKKLKNNPGLVDMIQQQLRSNTAADQTLPETTTWRSRIKESASKLTFRHFIVGMAILVFLGLAIALIVMLAKRFKKNRDAKGSPGTILSSASTRKSEDTVSAKFTVPKPGTNWGLSMWLFLEDFEYTNGMKSVLHVSSKDSLSDLPDMAMWLDTDVPRLWIALRNAAPNSNTINSNTNTSNTANTQTIVTRGNLMQTLLVQSCAKSMLDNAYNKNTSNTSNNNNNNKCVEYKGHFLTVVDYIPLREWTHITIGVDGPIVSIYKNGSPLLTTRASALIKPPTDSVLRVGRVHSDSALFAGNVMSAVAFTKSTPSSIEANNGFLNPPFKDRYDNGESSLNAKKKACDC